MGSVRRADTAEAREQARRWRTHTQKVLLRGACAARGALGRKGVTGTAVCAPGLVFTGVCALLIQL